VYAPEHSDVMVLKVAIPKLHTRLRKVRVQMTTHRLSRLRGKKIIMLAIVRLV
jgi:hypothetical protein